MTVRCRPSAHLLCTALLLASACGSTVEESVVPTIEPTSLQRLTRAAWAATVGDLLGPEAADVVAARVWLLPEDVSKDRYDTEALAVTNAHITGWMSITEQVAARVARDAKLRTALTGCTGALDGDPDCLRTFVQRFAHRAWRRPLTTIELDAVMSIVLEAAVDSPAEAVETAIVAMLISPYFVYRVELGDESLGSEYFRLTAHEQVTRLSFALWGKGPAQELLDVAAAHDHFSRDQLRALARNMLKAPQARAHILEFYRQWLGIRHMQSVRAGEPFIPFSEQAGLREDMTTELHDFVLHHTFASEGTYRDLMTSDFTSVQSDNHAKIYGMPTKPADKKAQFEGDIRHGLLTRPGMLVSTRESTSPVRRGVFVLEHLLCQTPGSPDPLLFADDEGLPPSADGIHTNRQRWDQKTSAAPCSGCHATINPFGFVMEGYDSAGRFRTEEYALPYFETGGSWLPVDTSASVLLDGQLVEIDDLAALGRALADSQAGPDCLARQWFRFAAGREAVMDDASVQALVAEFDADTPLVELMAALAATDVFQWRRIAQ